LTLLGYLAEFIWSDTVDHLDEIYLAHSLKAPRIGFGTAAMGGNTEEIVCLALSFGIRLFDTAQAVEWYDEEGLGNALTSCWKGDNDFDDLLIVTKIHPRSFYVEDMKKAIQRSQDLIYIRSNDLST